MSGPAPATRATAVEAKTVLTDVGPVEINVPRDRQSTFEPKIARKRQRRLSGVDDMVISLTAKGLTTGEVQAHRTRSVIVEMACLDTFAP